MWDIAEPDSGDPVAGIPRHRLRPIHAGRATWHPSAFLLPATWVFVATLAVHLPNFAPRLVVYLVIGGAIAAMDVVMHEAAHGHLYTSPGLNRWIGFLFGAPGLISLSAYRAFHLRHHAQSLSMSASEGFLNGTPAYLFGVPLIALRSSNRRTRLRILVEYSVLALGIALLVLSGVALGFAARIVDLWLIPLAVAVVITSIRGWTETAAAYLVRKQRVLRAAWSRPLYRLTCDHLEHHLFPGVPWGNLPLLRSELKLQHALRGGGKSYLDFLWHEVEAHARSAVNRKPLSSREVSHA